MKFTYRSKPFEAFQLASDMRNWKEALEFMGQEPGDEWEGTPAFLDVDSLDGPSEAYGTNYIARTPEGGFQVWPAGAFETNFEKHESHA